jgi:heme/copper-type cytochrome/quinol oxidase subunit 3
MAEATPATPLRLPVGPIGRHGLGSWGVGALVATEASLFGYLLFSYYYLGAVAEKGWVLDPTPPLKLALPNTIILLLSSLLAWMGERGVLRRKRGLALSGFAGALVLGIAFFAIQLFEWHAKPYQLGTSSYASLYFVTTGFHMAHVAIGLLILAALFGWTLLDYFSPRRNLSVSAGVLYWHFVDVVWLFVFATYYLSPYLGFGT